MEDKIDWNNIDDVKKELRATLARSLAKNQTIKELQRKLEDTTTELTRYQRCNWEGNKKFLDYIKTIKDEKMYNKLWAILEIYEGLYYDPAN